MKRVAAVIALLVSLAILASLGTWQANRYINKRELFDLMDDRIPREIVSISSATSLDDPAMQFRRVRLEGGEWRWDHSVGVARRFFRNKPGHWVLTPYVFEDGTAVWVQRGWAPDTVWQNVASTPDPDGLAPVGLVQRLAEVVPDPLARGELAEGTFDLTRQPELGELDTGLLHDALGARTSPRDIIIVLGEDYADLRGEHPPIPTVTHITQPYLTPMTHFGYAFLWYGAAVLLCWIFWAGWAGRLDANARP